jgi:hypothetical protein
MRFAPVANLPTYKELKSRGQLGTYHLLIATEVLKNPARWSEFWVQPGHDDFFIIMDNGLIETGQPTDPESLREAAEAVEADCIVLPDVLGSYDKTIKAVKASLSEMRQTGYPLMGVIQGRTWNEVDYISAYYKDIDVKFLAIPRVMVELFGTRLSLLTRVRQYPIAIHLLGFSENLWDDVICTTHPGVMGIDSAVPLWYRGVLPPSPPTNAGFGPRPRDYWDADPSTMNYANVERVRQWLNAAPVVRSVGVRRGLEDQPTPPSA